MLVQRKTPFDIVYMWVNGTEPTYAANRRRYGGLPRAGDRDRDNGELRMSMRSLDKHMPWFDGNIFFVHQNLPCWLDLDHPRLIPVHHRDIFTDQNETLPTFSSDAIEAHLHNIPGIKPTFVLFNDDFFLMSDVVATDFVLTTGEPVMYFEKYTAKGTKEDYLEYKKKRVKNWLAKEYHTKSMLVDRYKISSSSRYHFLKHAPFALRTDLMAALWDMWPAEMARSARYRFRDHDGVDALMLHHHACLFDSKYRCYSAPQTLSDKATLFVKTGAWKTDELVKALANAKRNPPKFLAVNDEADGKKNVDGTRYAYETYLPTLYNKPSQWERLDVCGSGPVPQPVSPTVQALLQKL